MSDPLLLIVGSVNYDIVLRHHRLPRAGETVAGATLTESCGGKGANQAIAAARFSKTWAATKTRIAFAGAIGNDVFGRRQLEQLRADGVDTSHLRVLDSASTGMSTIWVDSATGENRILNAPGANLCVKPAHLEDLPMEEAAIVLLQNEIPPEATGFVCRAAAQQGVAVVWDPAPFPSASELPLDPSQVCFVTPNEAEAEGLLQRPLDKEALEAEAAAIRSLGFGTVILTLGASGVAVADGERTYRVPAPPTVAVDTTAAGDAFSGAFAASLVAGLSEDEAIRNGVEYASASVLRSGAQTSFT